MPSSPADHPTRRPHAWRLAAAKSFLNCCWKAGCCCWHMFRFVRLALAPPKPSPAIPAIDFDRGEQRRLLLVLASTITDRLAGQFHRTDRTRCTCLYDNKIKITARPTTAPADQHLAGIYVHLPTIIATRHRPYIRYIYRHRSGRPTSTTTSTDRPNKTAATMFARPRVLRPPSSVRLVCSSVVKASNSTSHGPARPCRPIADRSDQHPSRGPQAAAGSSQVYLHPS